MRDARARLQLPETRAAAISEILAVLRRLQDSGPATTRDGYYTDLAQAIGVHPRTLYRWLRLWPELRDGLATVRREGGAA